MNYSIIGVDPSSHRLAVVVLGAQPEWRVRSLPTDEIARVAQAYSWMEWFIKRRVAIYPTYVAIEKPVMGIGGPGSTIPQAEVHGALVAAAVHAGAVYIEKVNNKIWKKSVVGSGSAKKEQIKDFVRLTWPTDYLEYEEKAKDNYSSVKQQELYISDLADARAIAEYMKNFVIDNGMV